MDFSSAGYEGGGVPLPDVPVRAAVKPSGRDDTAAIQTAINQVAARSPDEKGFRGAVRLEAGQFHVSATLRISTSGVVLTGSGSGADGTVITIAGKPFVLLSIAGTGSPVRGPAVALVGEYIPSGALSVQVADASGFHVGDTVLIGRPITAAWVHAMGMDTLTRNGTRQTWIEPGTETLTDRTIAAISGNTLTLNAPLTDSVDGALVKPPGATISAYTFPGRIAQAGAEHFSVVAPGHATTRAQFSGIRMTAVINGWLSDIAIRDTENSVSVSRMTRQITVDHVRIAHSYPQTNAAAPADFAISGTQLLFNQCRVTGLGNTWPFVTQNQVTGPVVILKCFADDRGFGPHQRWATGLLCDLTEFPRSFTGDKAGVSYSNRGYYGSGHGWDSGWSVAWNVTTPYLLVQAPPGATNWCIGCVGEALSESAPGDAAKVPNGTYESLGKPVKPGSLYLAQLKQRLGVAALHTLGYADTDGNPLTAVAAAR